MAHRARLRWGPSPTGVYSAPVSLARTDEYVIVGQAVMRQACSYVIAPPRCARSATSGAGSSR